MLGLIPAALLCAFFSGCDDLTYSFLPLAEFALYPLCKSKQKGYRDGSLWDEGYDLACIWQTKKHPNS